MDNRSRKEPILGSKYALRSLLHGTSVRAHPNQLDDCNVVRDQFTSIAAVDSGPFGRLRTPTKVAESRWKSAAEQGRGLRRLEVSAGIRKLITTYHSSYVGSVTEVAHAGKYHRDAQFVRPVDNLSVPDRTSRLDHGCCSGSSHSLQPIREREVCVGGGNASPE